MTGKAEIFMALVKAGKIDEAQAMLKAEKIKAKYSPDTIEQKTGEPARFTKKGKTVELGTDGNWHFSEK